MARGSLTVNGVDKLVGKLRRNANLNDVKNIVKMNGSELQRGAQRNAPVDTGNLKRNINLHIEDNGFTAKVVSHAEYSGYVEFGTRWIYPRRFVGKAFHKQKRKFNQDMKRIMK